MLREDEGIPSTVAQKQGSLGGVEDAEQREEEESSSDTASFQVVPSSKAEKTPEISDLDLLEYTKKKNVSGYRQLIDTLKCVHVKNFGYARLSCGDGLAWLSPYTGNQHNRCLFIQLALAATMRYSTSPHYASTLFEAFMGSGQVSLNYHWCRGLFGSPTVRVRAGDINLPLSCAWENMCTDSTLVGTYLAYASAWDSQIENAYPVLKHGINLLIECLSKRRPASPALKKQLEDYLSDWDWQDTNEDEDEDEDEDEEEEEEGEADFDFDVESALRRLIGILYVYLNNRCVLSTTYNVSTGIVSATIMKDHSKSKLSAIREREAKRLALVQKYKGEMSLRFEESDFAATTEGAGLGDLVVYDCPFPEYACCVSSTQQQQAKELSQWKSKPVKTAFDLCRTEAQRTSMTGGNHYGINDGATLQLRILEDAIKKVQAGASVVLCNYATPELMLWYGRVFAALYQDDAIPIYLLKRPGKGDQLYLFMVLPGTNVMKRHNSVAQFLRDRIWKPYSDISEALQKMGSVPALKLKQLLGQAWTPDQLRSRL
jgi:site-specific DNA-adenine methylase